ncbi:MAG TPA: PDZ domain-containing protein, partial [Prolixibacteraceae bacterium]|nr:PDZ domain-containing protein [Prolixibacteraceae bacterium]
LQEMVARHRPGDEVDIVVMRDGKEVERTTTLQNMEGTTDVVSEKRGELQSILGAELTAISGDQARELNINGGVKITRLYPGKLRSETNIKEGFIITKVNTQSVKSVDELTNVLKATSGGVMLEGKYEDDSEIRYYAFGL